MNMSTAIVFSNSQLRVELKILYCNAFHDFISSYIYEKFELQK